MSIVQKLKNPFLDYPAKKAVPVFPKENKGLYSPHFQCMGVTMLQVSDKYDYLQS